MMTTSTIVMLTAALVQMATSFSLPPPPPPPMANNNKVKFVMPGATGSAPQEPPLPPAVEVRKSATFVVPASLLSNQRMPPPPIFIADDFVDEETDNSIEQTNEQGQKKPDEFYDILYADLITCPLKSFSAKDRSFFGSAFRILAVNDPTECMTLCFHDTRCKSINVLPYEQNKFACELNEFDQTDSPYLLIGRQGAVYYDRIRCDSGDVVETPVEEARMGNSVTPKSYLIEKFNNMKDHEVEGAHKTLKDLDVKLNRLAMLEKIMKIFVKAPTID